MALVDMESSPVTKVGVLSMTVLSMQSNQDTIYLTPRTIKMALNPLTKAEGHLKTDRNMTGLIPPRTESSQLLKVGSQSRKVLNMARSLILIAAVPSKVARKQLSNQAMEEVIL